MNPVDCTSRLDFGNNSSRDILSPSWGVEIIRYETFCQIFGNNSSRDMPEANIPACVVLFVKTILTNHGDGVAEGGRGSDCRV